MIGQHFLLYFVFARAVSLFSWWCFMCSYVAASALMSLDFFHNRWQELKYNPSEYSDVYKHNSPKEEVVLSYAENFRRQYVHLYRDRKPLLLNPLNECGVEVCIVIMFMNWMVWYRVTLVYNLITLWETLSGVLLSGSVELCVGGANKVRSSSWHHRWPWLDL